MKFNWNNVKPTCCAKWLVLPTVYSDALSYGEQLDKFCYQLNKIIENNNILPNFIAEMIKEYISSGAIGEVVRDILADYILNVKYPPEGITPAVGDGSADDTAAIQGCIDYAAENGGVVYFPYGSYLTQPLTMKDGVSLFGFDRYSTKIVLKGGATKPLIGGTVADLSIANLTLDGNSGIQVNDVNVVTIVATNVLFTNLIIKDGYTLVNYVGTGGHFQISDVVFGNAVEKCLLTAGNADVQCENVVFNQLSAVGGVSVMDIGTDGGFFNVKSLATCNQCIVVTGNNNKISAIVENAAIPVVDNGLQNNIEIFGISNKEFYSGDTTKDVSGSYSKHVGGTYTKAVGGNASEDYAGDATKEVNGNYSKRVDGTYTKAVGGNASEDYAGDYSKVVTGETLETFANMTVNLNTENKNVSNSVKNVVGKHWGLEAETAEFNCVNPLVYNHPPKKLENFFGGVFRSIPLSDGNETYNVLVSDNRSYTLGSYNVKDFGAVGDGVTDDTDAINKALLTASNDGFILYFPTGTYKITSMLLPYSNNIIDGCGSTIVGENLTAVFGIKDGIENVCIRRFKINATLSGVSLSAIYCNQESKYIVIEECEIYNTSRCVGISSNVTYNEGVPTKTLFTEYVVIRNCYFHDSQGGIISGGGEHVEIYGNTIKNMASQECITQDRYSKFFYVHDNTLINGMGTGCVGIDNAEYGYYYDNYISNDSNTPFGVRINDHEGESKGIIIANNVVETSNTDILLGYSGSVYSCYDIIVTGNKCTSVSGIAINRFNSKGKTVVMYNASQVLNNFSYDGLKYVMSQKEFEVILAQSMFTKGTISATGRKSIVVKGDTCVALFEYTPDDLSDGVVASLPDFLAPYLDAALVCVNKSNALTSISVITKQAKLRFINSYTQQVGVTTCSGNWKRTF